METVYAVLATLLMAAGLCAQTTAPDAVIRKLASEVSPDRIGASIKTLVGFETRGNYSDPNQKNRGIGAARRWIFDQMRGYSQRLEVSYETARKDTTDIVSVIAVLPGVEKPEQRIIVSAHYDSINVRARGTRAAEAPAPGADDDASGTAVVLELARVMSRYRFRKTIVFIAFGGEEVGLVGSTHYASRAKANHEQIEAVFNNDIVGANVVGVVHNDVDGSDDLVGGDGDTGNRLRVYSPDPQDSPSRRIARLVQEAAGRYVPRLHIELVSSADRYGRGGDHLPFQANGFAAVRLTSASEHSNTQHTADDAPEEVSPSFTADVARANGVAIAILAVRLN